MGGTVLFSRSQLGLNFCCGSLCMKDIYEKSPCLNFVPYI